MKILKRPDNIIFDTENPNIMEFKPTFPNLLIPLSENILTNDYEYLKEFFQPQNNVTHPIFSNFGSSYFYIYYDVKKKTKFQKNVSKKIEEIVSKFENDQQ